MPKLYLCLSRVNIQMSCNYKYFSCNWHDVKALVLYRYGFILCSFWARLQTLVALWETNPLREFQPPCIRRQRHSGCPLTSSSNIRWVLRTLCSLPALIRPAYLLPDRPRVVFTDYERPSWTLRWPQERKVP